MSIALADIARRTRVYYNSIARRYHDLFKHELEEKVYDREWLDRFASEIPRGALVCDAGCGPCAHTTAYLAGKGLRVIGTDISEACLALARREHRSLPFVVMDIGQTGFADESLSGILAYYSIIYTPKRYQHVLFSEFRRTLKRGRRLAIAVKEGEGERVIDDPLESGMKTLFVWFTEAEIRALLEDHGFEVLSVHVREPYDFEISDRRIFAVGVKR